MVTSCYIQIISKWTWIWGPSLPVLKAVAHQDSHQADPSGSQERRQGRAPPLCALHGASCLGQKRSTNFNVRLFLLVNFMAIFFLDKNMCDVCLSSTQKKQSTFLGDRQAGDNCREQKDSNCLCIPGRLESSRTRPQIAGRSRTRNPAALVCFDIKKYA